MKKPMMTLNKCWIGAALAMVPLVAGQTATDLFISEYVEGSSWNKAIEIYNGTGDAVDLGHYSLRSQVNGASEFSSREDLTGSLAAGATLVLCDDSADPAVLAVADVLVPSSPLNFNGDDVVALFKDGVPIDFVGIPGVVWGQDVTLRRKPEVSSPKAAFVVDEWEAFSKDAFDDLGKHAFTGPSPEPSAHVADFSAVFAETRIELSWTDPMGERLPDQFLVLVSANAALPAPVDGFEIPEDIDLSDGNGVYYVPLGQESFAVSGVRGGVAYFIAVYPFTNAGEAIDYRTVGPVPSTSVTVDPFVLEQTFESLGSWAAVALGGAPRWTLRDGVAIASAYSETGGTEEASDDWLISPPVNFDAMPDLVVNFDARRAFDDTESARGLTVLVSTDYAGTGTAEAVNSATWNELSAVFPDPGTEVFVNSGNIPLNGFSGSGHIAFRYEASGTGMETAEEWSLDNVFIFSSKNVLPAISLGLSTTSIEEDAGPASVHLVISVPDELTSPLTIELSTGVAEILALPPVAQIPAGSRSVTVAFGPIKNLELEAAVSVAIQAKANGFLMGSAELEVKPAPGGELMLELADATIPEDAGSAASAGTVTLTKAPSSFPVLIKLTSSDPTKATAPALVAIENAAGLSQSFPIAAVHDRIHGPDTQVTFTASHAVFGTASATLTVRNVDPEPEIILLVEPSGFAENGTAMGTVFLSERALNEVRVSLASSDPSEAAVIDTVAIPAGAQVRSFVIKGVHDEGVDGDQSVSIMASAPGWVSAQRSVIIFDIDIPRTLTLTPRASTITEGESTTVDVTLSAPTEDPLTLTLHASNDVSMPATLALPAGSTAGSFVLTAVSGDGFEGAETVEISAVGGGYTAGVASLEIVNRDSQLTWSYPSEAQSFAAGETIELVVDADDPEGVLGAVVFLVNDIQIAHVTTAPFVAKFVPEDEGTLALVAYAQHVDGHTHSRIERAVEVHFSPPRNAEHFVRQTIIDFLGEAGLTDARKAHYTRTMESGARESVVASLLEEPGVRHRLDAMETVLLVFDRIPSPAELGEIEFLAADGSTLLPPMAAIVAAGPTHFFDTGQRYPGGVRGLAIALQESEEAALHFAGNPENLSNADFFRIIWQNRHGTEPTAQQLVQAHNRVVTFGRQRPDSFARIEEPLYGRSRFIEALVLREQFAAGTDVIHDPPNEISRDDAVTALLIQWLWGASDAQVAREDTAAWQGMDLQTRIRTILFHPNYWDRFDYSWLAATPDAAEPTWRYSPWFGWFHYRNSEWPWLYHLSHAWIYAANDAVGGAGIWYFDQVLGWSWSSEGIHPWVYRSESESWYFYQSGSREPRWFYNGVEGAWDRF